MGLTAIFNKNIAQLHYDYVVKLRYIIRTIFTPQYMFCMGPHFIFF